jgi:hypothetical protein
MKGLKQTLGREDPKKHKKTNLTTTANKKKSQWTDVILCVHNYIIYLEITK